jgi:RNA recognition motif-containing protein
MDQSDFPSPDSTDGSDSTRDQFSGKSRYVNIFIGGVGIDETENTVLEEINKIVKVRYLKLIREKNKTENKGFGFIHVANMEEANLILGHDIRINGKLSETYIAHPRREARRKIHSDRNKKIFIGGLTLQTSSKDLKNFFSQYGIVGELLRAYVIYDSKTQFSRCFGFLEFDNEFDPENILKIKHFKLNEHIVEAKSMMLKKEIEENNKETNFSIAGIANDPIFQDALDYPAGGEYPKYPEIHSYQAQQTGFVDWSMQNQSVSNGYPGSQGNQPNSGADYYYYSGGNGYQMNNYSFGDTYSNIGNNQYASCSGPRRQRLPENFYYDQFTQANTPQMVNYEYMCEGNGHIDPQRTQFRQNKVISPAGGWGYYCDSNYLNFLGSQASNQNNTNG